MENANKENKHVISYPEFIGIIILFSFLFYILYPKDTIFEYVNKEDKNIVLTETYLKNIISKYPKNLNFFFSLIDLYLKQGKVEEAYKLITQFEDKTKELGNQKLAIYKNRLALNLLKKENTNELLKIKNFYISDIIWQNEDKDKFIDEFILKMIAIGEYEIARDSLIYVIEKNQSFENKKLALLKYINLIRKERQVKTEVSKIKKYEDIFLKDQTMSNEIIKIYFEAGKPEMARDLALKIIKFRKII